MQSSPPPAGREIPLPRLWAVMLGPPVIWAVRFAVVYVLVPYVCRADALILLHVITVLSVAAVAALGVLSWRQRAAARSDRARFMALCGILSSALFAVVVAAEGVANLLVDPCLASGPLLP